MAWNPWKAIIEYAQSLQLGGGGPAPGNTKERISICMRNYQRAKKQWQRAMRSKETEIVLMARYDMQYWEVYLKEVGAMSLMMASAPYGGAGNWNTPRYVERRRENAEKRAGMREPYFKFYDPVPEATEE